MKTRTLSKEEALAICEANEFNEHHVIVINALAEIAPAQVVADTVVAFVKYKEAQS